MPAVSLGVWHKPPGPVLITLVVALCAVELFTSWNVGGQSRLYFPLMLLGSVVLFLVCLARIGVAAGHLEWTRTRVLRAVICPVVLLGSFVLVVGDVPMRVRFALSQPSLDAYVRSLRHLPAGSYCDTSDFEKRRVGWFTVRCADRPAAGVVALELDSDPLVPNGIWFLVWERYQHSDAQNVLDEHWSLGVQD